MGKKKGKGKAARNAKLKQNVDVDASCSDTTNSPHSFIFHRGHVGKTVKELVHDLRKIMEPFTASKLKVQKKNVLKDFLTVAGPMHVSHFIVLTKSDVATHLRLMCVPKGPTLTFKVNDFCLARDVLSAQRHPNVESKLFSNYAVLVTNIPSDTMENKLMNITFKNMFPSINPNTVNLNTMRRTVLINHDPSNKSIDIRHYTVKVVPMGVSRGVKKLMKSKLPDMSHHTDIADLFLEKGSESEGEMDGPNSQVPVMQKIKDRGVSANTTNSIRLKEIGPRLNLQLIKVEEGFGSGNVLFHAFIEKTAEELGAQRAMKKEKQKEKTARRQKQETNIRRKELDKEAQVLKSKEGMERKRKQADEQVMQNKKPGEKESDSDEEIDDVEYYRREVGQEPEPELFSTHGNKRKSQSSTFGPRAKKMRKDMSDSDRKPSKFEKAAKGQREQSKFSVAFNVKGGKKKPGFSKPGSKSGKPTQRGLNRVKNRAKRV